MNKTKHIALFWVIGLMLLITSAVAGVIEVNKNMASAVSPEKVEEVLKVPVKDYDQTAYDKGRAAFDQEVLMKTRIALNQEMSKCSISNDITRIEACTTALKNVNAPYEPAGKGEEEEMI